jgi:hypothetical protein
MACRQVLAVWPGQADAAYLLGIMGHAFGSLDLAIAHLRQACQSPHVPFARMATHHGFMGAVTV